MLCKVTHCAGCVSANTRLRVFKSLVETPRKHHLFAQLSCVRRSYIAIIIIICHVLLECTLTEALKVLELVMDKT